MKVCKKCIVSGGVQGVFYRASTSELATDKGVSGWAKNLTNGTVEVMLCGELQQVDIVVEWLWQGPVYANVETVEIEDQQYQPIAGFSTG